jgi:large subunit ribosomal protein L25
MVEAVQLKVTKREKLGTAENRRLRQRGVIPGIVYGHKQAPVPVAVSAHAFRHVVALGTHVVDIELGGAVEKAVIREVQWDTFGGEVQHVDFVRVDPNERVSLDLAVELRGTAPGTLAGGILEQPLHSLHVDCPVVSIPKSILVRINHLNVGGVVHVRDLELPPGVHVQNPPDAIVVHVVAARAEVEELVPAEAGPTEPEVIGRKPAEPEEE